MASQLRSFSAVAILLVLGAAVPVPEELVEGAAAATMTANLGYITPSAIVSTASNGLGYLNFSNIRYAAAPTGAARFSPPSVPTSLSGVLPGSRPVICPQANPEWIDVDIEFLTGQPLSGGPTPNYTESDIPATDPRTSEDCLFLDVIVPTDVFKNQSRTKAAVVVYIHGGGFWGGHKADYGDGLGLVMTSKANGGPGIVYVAINYRLGLFGWMAGSSYKSQGGTQNLGLLDQRFALAWIKKYVGFFGGDPNRITVLGESAGAGSILAHTVSTGGAPFDQAIAQSPYMVEITSSKQDETFQKVLEIAGVENLKALKALSSAQLHKTNALLIGNSSPWAFTILGPVVDGSLLTDIPSALLAKGQFDETVSVITGHTGADGLLFTNPYIATSDDYTAYLRAFFPNISPSSLSYINNSLYPADYTSKYGYTSQFGHTNATIGEVCILCNTLYLQNAYKGRSWGYNYVYQPGIHADDLYPTFYPRQPAYPVPVNTALANTMQTYFTTFASTGNPNTAGQPNWPLAGTNVVMNLDNFVATAGDTAPANRCAWWQKGLYR